MGAVLLGREFVARAHVRKARSARRSCSRPKIPRAHLVVASAFAVFSATLVPAAAASFLVGTWYGTGQPNDKSEMWVARMGAHGEFHAEFRTCVKGHSRDQTNAGHWTIAGDVVTVTIETVNDKPSPRTDEYKVTSHDAKSQTYTYLPTGFVYHSRRVPDSFQLPSCESIS